MGAILSGLVEWLAPYLVQLALFVAGSVWARLGAILGVGFATFAGLDTITNLFLGYVSSSAGYTSLMAAFIQLLGINTALSMIAGAVVARLAIMKAKVILTAL